MHIHLYIYICYILYIYIHTRIEREREREIVLQGTQGDCISDTGTPRTGAPEDLRSRRFKP